LSSVSALPQAAQGFCEASGSPQGRPPCLLWGGRRHRAGDPRGALREEAARGRGQHAHRQVRPGTPLHNAPKGGANGPPPMPTELHPTPAQADEERWADGRAAAGLCPRSFTNLGSSRTNLHDSTTLYNSRPAPPTPRSAAPGRGRGQGRGGGGLSRGAADEEQLLNSRTLACLLDGPCAPPRCRGVAPLAPLARAPMGAAGGGSHWAASASAAAPATAGAAPTARALEVASSWQA